MNRTELLLKLKNTQKAIVPESDEDEAAGEYHGEVQSVIDVIEAGGTDEEIQKAADWVGISLAGGR